MDEVKLLKKLGFSEYESRAYLSLAKLGPSSVKEIVVDSNIPRNKAYEALQKLETKNKILSLPITPKKYKINDPEIFKEEIKELDSSIENLIRIIEQPKITQFKELFWVIKGKNAIEEKLASQNLKSENEILACNNLSRILYKNIQTMKEAVKKGINVKIICDFDKNKNLIYKEWLNTGARIRVFNKKHFGPLLPRITVFDGKIARLTIGKPEVKEDKDYMTLWTESKVFSQMLKKHFMTMWKKSIPLEKFMK